MGLLCAAGDKGANFWGSWRETETGLPTLVGSRNHTRVAALLQASEPGAPHKGGRGIDWVCWFFFFWLSPSHRIKKGEWEAGTLTVNWSFIIAAQIKMEKQQHDCRAHRELVTLLRFKPIIGCFPEYPHITEKETYFIWPWMSLCGCLLWGYRIAPQWELNVFYN